MSGRFATCMKGLILSLRSGLGRKGLVKFSCEVLVLWKFLGWRNAMKTCEVHNWNLQNNMERNRFSILLLLTEGEILWWLEVFLQIFKMVGADKGQNKMTLWNQGSLIEWRRDLFFVLIVVIKSLLYLSFTTMKLTKLCKKFAKQTFDWNRMLNLQSAKISVHKGQISSFHLLASI